MSGVETDVLIVGSGPAGGAAALALATYGIPCMVVTRYGWTARTPRAHITNQRTMEVMRDLGVEDEVIDVASPQSSMGNHIFCTALAGEELGRIHSWGNGPYRLADYTAASPTEMCDIPQHLMEPILISNAAKRGATVRFDTEFLRFEQDGDGVTATVRDAATGHDYDIRAKYLIGADGGNSAVAKQAGLPLAGKMGVAGSVNILFEADLSHLVAHRPSVLYAVIQPGAQVGGVGMAIIRMIRRWNKWMIVYGYDLAVGPPEMTDDRALSIIRQLVGIPDLQARIDGVSLWTVNDCWAERMAEGRVFIAGDAAHRHPPTNGLGSNVSIQDSYNLAWKLAFVLKGWAGPALLESYDAERAPVAAQTVSRAGRSIAEYGPIFGALGFEDAADPEEMRAGVERLKVASPEGAAARKALRRAIDAKAYEYNAHGVEMNQRYVSDAVRMALGDADPGFERDGELYHQFSSAPGAKLPHAWLERATHRVSTLDLVGQGAFTVLTGLGGEAWVDAASAWSAASGVPVRSHLIGPGRDYRDMLGDWSGRSGIAEDGALLVRPDGYVAWRAVEGPGGGTEGLVQALEQVLARPAPA
ncbi:MAG: FAD-dependent monooxygenase [Pseudomonadota bacterium]